MITTDHDIMIMSQLKQRGIRDTRVLNAMRRVPRESFVPGSLASYAYEDGPLPIGEGQTISQPYMVARMTELLHVSTGNKVLEIGTGSGYQSAVLAELGARLFTVERFASLSEKARQDLENAGYHNIHFHVGDGTLGWPLHAPYDRIIVTAGGSIIPAPLAEQLADGGIIVIPLGDRFLQHLIIGEKKNGTIRTLTGEPCVFVPLTGKFGIIESDIP